MSKICDYCKEPIKEEYKSVFQIGGNFHQTCLEKKYVEDKLRLELTCHRNPEQYDVYLKDIIVGYIRFRYGGLEIWGDHMGVMLIEEQVGKDKWIGRFTTEERSKYLGIAKKKITEWVINKKRIMKEGNYLRCNCRHYAMRLSSGILVCTKCYSWCDDKYLIYWHDGIPGGDNTRGSYSKTNHTTEE